MPIPIGILAASGAGGGGAYEHIATIEVNPYGGTAEFANLSQYASTYQHLQLRMKLKNFADGEAADVSVDFGVSGTTYVASYFRRAAALNQRGVRSASSIGIDIFGAINDTSLDSFTSYAILDIIDPFETTKNTVVKGFSGYDTRLTFHSGMHLSTSAATRVRITAGQGLFEQSTFSLYGIKGA